MTTDLGSIHDLLKMLRVRRPAGSRSERRFIREWIEPLGVKRDNAGNLMKRIGTSPILWSSHTDTVHKDGGLQSIEYASGVVSLTKGSRSNCLGADCTAGVWIMREMIRAKIPGLYVFHREEESGGIGSAFIRDETPDVLAGVNAAIAFDRRGTGSIITHQWGGRSASDTFAHSLGDALCLPMTPDSGGTFTDTANYVDIVPECTNLSVGFAGEHSARETLDVMHLITLRDAILSADFSRLEYTRDPMSWEPTEPKDPRGDWSSFSYAPKRGSIFQLVRDYPDEVADILEAFGMDYASVSEEIELRRGFGRH